MLVNYECWYNICLICSCFRSMVIDQLWVIITYLVPIFTINAYWSSLRNSFQQYIQSFVFPCWLCTLLRINGYWSIYWSTNKIILLYAYTPSITRNDAFSNTAGQLNSWLYLSVTAKRNVCYIDCVLLTDYQISRSAVSDIHTVRVDLSSTVN